MNLIIINSYMLGLFYYLTSNLGLQIGQVLYGTMLDLDLHLFFSMMDSNPSPAPLSNLLEEFGSMGNKS